MTEKNNFINFFEWRYLDWRGSNLRRNIWDTLNRKSQVGNNVQPMPEPHEKQQEVTGRRLEPELPVRPVYEVTILNSQGGGYNIQL